jgi:hydroxymethylbilane synthase
MIIVGARSSLLSQAQVKEVLLELQQHHPSVTFKPIFVKTQGDKDQKTSLRTLDKTDFFTKEVDEMLLSGQCRIGIHSAKDLPKPIPKGISIVAITHGLDSSDSLVFRKGESLQTLPEGAIVATSSVRREECVRKLRRDLRFIDLRGTIGQRLEKLENGEADAVVLAEAALVRLDLTHLNRIRIPGETACYQGQLAITALKEDHEMHSLFNCINTQAS